LKFKTDFHSKMSVCRHKLGVVQPPPSPGNSNSGIAHVLATYFLTYFLTFWWCLDVVEQSGVGYDSGHVFEQRDFTNSPMSEYGPLGKTRYLVGSRSLERI